MSRVLGSFAALCVGLVVLLATRRGDHLAYVKDSLTWPLIVSSLVLVVLAGAAWWRALRDLDAPGDAPDPHVHHGHAHAHGPAESRVAWAFLVPFVLLAALPPTPVGAYTAARVDDNRDARVVVGAPPEYAPLPPGDAAVAMPVREFWERASFDPRRSLDGRTVRLVGFAEPGDEAPAGGWRLTRMAILCCAADAFPVKVDVLGGEARPAAGGWYAVEGVWEPDPAAPPPGAADAGSVVPRLRMTSVSAVAQPPKPYE